VRGVGRRGPHDQIYTAGVEKRFGRTGILTGSNRHCPKFETRRDVPDLRRWQGVGGMDADKHGEAYWTRSSEPWHHREMTSRKWVRALAWHLDAGAVRGRR